MRLRDALGAFDSNHRKKVQPVESDAIRPKGFDSFIGQTETVEILRITTYAAIAHQRMPDHILLTGPGGTGKTTLALIMANELPGGHLVTTSAAILNQDNLTKMLIGLKDRTVVFVDEIHMIPPKVRELLYMAMEDGFFDMSTVEGTERIRLPEFTLIGATTLPGKLPDSFRDRFGIGLRVTHYAIDDLVMIAHRTALALNKTITTQAAEMLADRSKLVPRVLNSLIARCMDVRAVTPQEEHEYDITVDIVRNTMKLHGIDDMGCDRLDRAVLSCLAFRFQNAQVGLENLSISVGEDPDTIRKDVEPWLIRAGMMTKTPKGRQITHMGRQHIEGENGQ